jgi:hypothetical protein
MCATVQEIMNGNHLWNDRMTKGNTISFHGGGHKFFFFLKANHNPSFTNTDNPLCISEFTTGEHADFC